MNNFNYSKLLKLLEYNKLPVYVHVQDQGFFYYNSLSSFIDNIRSGDYTIKELGTYNISNICIQKSLFEDSDFLIVYLI